MMNHPIPPLPPPLRRTRRATGVARFAAGLTALAAGAAMVIGATMALFSATRTSSDNTFTSGTVTVGLGSESVTCEIPQIMPGDSSAGYSIGSKDLSTCVYDVVYTGNAPAWLAVDVKVDGGTPSLYTAASDGFQLQLKTAAGLSLVSGTSYTKIDGTTSSLVNGAATTNLLLATSPASQNQAVKFNLDYMLPTAAPNTLQGGTVSVTLTFHAVQSDNQPVGSCTAGRQCNSITWS